MEIFQAMKQRQLYTTFTDTEGNNCFSIYHTETKYTKIDKKKLTLELACTLFPLAAKK